MLTTKKPVETSTATPITTPAAMADDASIETPATLQEESPQESVLPQESPFKSFSIDDINEDDKLEDEPELFDSYDDGSPEFGGDKTFDNLDSYYNDDDDNAQLDSAPYDSVQLDSVPYDSVQLDSAPYDMHDKSPSIVVVEKHVVTDNGSMMPGGAGITGISAVGAAGAAGATTASNNIVLDFFKFAFIILVAFGVFQIIYYIKYSKWWWFSGEICVPGDKLCEARQEQARAEKQLHENTMKTGNVQKIKEENMKKEATEAQKLLALEPRPDYYQTAIAAKANITP